MNRPMRGMNTRGVSLLPVQSNLEGLRNLKGQNLVISGDDLKAINRTSIALADGSGYLATLDVFHELHCL